MNNILKVEYGHEKNNKTMHLTLGGLGVTALFNLLEGIFGQKLRFLCKLLNLCIQSNFFNIYTFLMIIARTSILKVYTVVLKREPTQLPTLAPTPSTLSLEGILDER